MKRITDAKADEIDRLIDLKRFTISQIALMANVHPSRVESRARRVHGLTLPGNLTPIDKRRMSRASYIARLKTHLGWAIDKHTCSGCGSIEHNFGKCPSEFARKWKGAAPE